MKTSFIFTEELVGNVIEWGKARGIHDGEILTQQLKFIAEIGELADAIIAENDELIVDSLGDSMVVLISILCMYKVPLDALKITKAIYEPYQTRIMFPEEAFTLIKNCIVTCETNPCLTIGYLQELARLLNKDLILCLSIAYDEIKDRVGKTLPNGNFVKEQAKKVEGTDTNA